MKPLTLCVAVFFSLLLFSYNVVKAQTIPNWSQDSSITANIQGSYYFTYAGQIYTLGGANNFVPIVGIHTKISTNGNLLGWNDISALPIARFWHAGAQKDNHIYLLGGSDVNSLTINNVSMANIDLTGDISSWITLTSLPQPLSLGASVIVGNKIYFAGGNITTNDAVTTSDTNQNIYMNTINSDGTLGPNWTTAGTLPELLRGFGMMEINNYLYIFGGENGTYAVTNAVRRAPINSTTGAIGAWVDLTGLQKPLWRFGLTRVGDTLIIVGGHNYSTGFSSSVYLSNIQSNGTLSAWQETTSLSETKCCGGLVSWGDKIYLIGGTAPNGYTNHVWQATVSGTTATPPPTPTPTPVARTIFVPGFGASWNADALLSCYADPDPKNWDLASYAADIYSPLIAALGTNTKAFYYDWRAQISSNSGVLSESINAFAPGSEKVNIIGHSMGGLVAADYLTNHDQGIKTKSLLTIGSPLKGSVQAYPAWAGGDIWQDNFLLKIAMTLYLKHCGGALSNDRETIQQQIPSVQNFLPIFDYLKNARTDVYKPWGSMVVQNNWLPITLANNFWGVKFGTLSGTGFDTLSEIPIRDPNKRDTSLGNWTDGKPAVKINTTAGDGTVLLSSSQIENENSSTINQTHSGLVNSIEGMTKILEFLGSAPPTFSSPFTEPNSALILIGYPANFWVTNDAGEIKSSKDGMVAYINPKSGKYRLNLIPKSGKTLFIAAQFLPNGKTLYKEYYFTNNLPQVRTLEFGLENPREDILK